MDTQQSERLHGLDAVRGGALLLGVVLHAAMSFMPNAQYFWIVGDASQGTAPGLVFYVIHMFRMTLFFLLAGYFGRLICERVGVKRFAQNRARRIALPLVIGWPLLLVALSAVLIWGSFVANGGSLPKEAPAGPAFTPDDFPLMHLWFLYLLLIFYGVMLSLRGMGTLVDRHGKLEAVVDRVFMFAGSLLAPGLLALPLAFIFTQQQGWMGWFGIPTPDRSLYPNIIALTAYGSAFTAGWLAQRQAAILEQWQRYWLPNLVIALITTTASLMMVGLEPAFVPVTHDVSGIAYAICYSIAVWSWALALVGMSLRFLSAPSPSRRYVADASYWIYMVHLPVIMALQVLVSGTDVGWYLKLPLVLFASSVALFGSYHLFVRQTIIGVLLNGRRHPQNVVSLGAAREASG